MHERVTISLPSNEELIAAASGPSGELRESFAFGVRWAVRALRERQRLELENAKQTLDVPYEPPASRYPLERADSLEDIADEIESVLENTPGW